MRDDLTMNEENLGSKIVIVFYPRDNKLSKGQIAIESVTNAVMAMMSAADHSSLTEIKLKLSMDPGDPERSLAAPWFADGSKTRFKVELKRALDANAYNTLFHWCQSENLPAARGETDGQGSCIVIGPFWSEKIDELLDRAFIEDESLRDFGVE